MGGWVPPFTRAHEAFRARAREFVLGSLRPHDAGSDVAALRTRAERVDGGWLVSGSKTFITNGVRAGFYVTAVRTGGPGHGGVSFLVIERGEGVQARALSKLGWRASDTAEIAFDEVFVPAGHLLGELDRGFSLIMANFQWERLVMALGAVGARAGGARRPPRPDRRRDRRDHARDPRAVAVILVLAHGQRCG